MEIKTQENITKKYVIDYMIERIHRLTYELIYVKKHDLEIIMDKMIKELHLLLVEIGEKNKKKIQKIECSVYEICRKLYKEKCSYNSIDKKSNYNIKKDKEKIINQLLKN